MRGLRGLAPWVAILLAVPARAFALDLTSAAVIAPPNLSPQEQKAVAMLVDEVEKRTGIRWPVTHASDGVRIEMISQPATPPEGYHIEVRAHFVRVIGNDARGVLFGAGRLLRELHMEKGAVTIADGWNESSTPKYPLRGHQLGYRPKTNSYDGWSVPVWEQ